MSKTSIYDKPVRILMRDMVTAFDLKPGQEFTRKQATDWFAKNYPRIRPGTISAHLTRFSINAPSRVHLSAKTFEDDLLFQIESGLYRLYEPSQDPTPIRLTTGQGRPLTEVDEVNSPEGAEFAYERDLRNYLARNLRAIEPGLTLYEDEDITGIEFPVGGRFIDILAVDSSGALVVIELKVSRGYDRVIGQLMRYMAWIGKNMTEPGQRVRGIIIARQISEDLLLACSLLDDVRLFEYELSVALKQVASRQDWSGSRLLEQPGPDR